MRIEGTIHVASRGGGRAWVVVDSPDAGALTLPIQLADYQRCSDLIGRVITWDAYPEVEPVKTEAEARAEETAFLVDALKARFGDITPEERAMALERLGVP